MIYERVIELHICYVIHVYIPGVFPISPAMEVRMIGVDHRNSLFNFNVSIFSVA